MKTYIVYVNGFEAGTIKAGSHNAAEKKAKAKHPGKDVSVAYTEVWMYEPKMMPGQEPYTEEELAQVSSLITAACEAEEEIGDGGQDFGYYELEDHAYTQAKVHDRNNHQGWV